MQVSIARAPSPTFGGEDTFISTMCQCQSNGSGCAAGADAGKATLAAAVDAGISGRFIQFSGRGKTRGATWHCTSTCSHIRLRVTVVVVLSMYMRNRFSTPPRTIRRMTEYRTRPTARYLLIGIVSVVLLLAVYAIRQAPLVYLDRNIDTNGAVSLNFKHVSYGFDYTVASTFGFLTACDGTCIVRLKCNATDSCSRVPKDKMTGTSVASLQSPIDLDAREAAAVQRLIAAPATHCEQRIRSPEDISTLCVDSQNRSFYWYASGLHLF